MEQPSVILKAIYTQENALQQIVYKMVAILSRP